MHAWTRCSGSRVLFAGRLPRPTCWGRLNRSGNCRRVRPERPRARRRTEGSRGAASMPRVLISDKLESAGLDLLRQAGIELDERQGLTGDALKEALRAADAVIVRSATKITAELLA